MKKLLIRVAAVTFLLFVGLLVYSIYDPYIAWFRAVPSAHITIDGKSEEGWLHRDTRGRGFVLTHGSGHTRESYMVTLTDTGRGYVWGCGDWIAPHFPVFSMGDVNPPCMNIVIDDATKSREETPIPMKLDLIIGEHFMEFNLTDGRRLKVTW